MANPRHLEILLQGVEAWNVWRKENSLTRPDLDGIKLMGRVGDEPPGGSLRSTNLSNASLRGATLWNLNICGANLHGVDARNSDLRSSNFRGSDLSGADLRNAALNGAILERSNLRNANLVEARLYQVDCTGADFTSVMLGGADLRGAIFFRSILADVDFTSASLGGTVFADVNLTAVRGLMTCQHVGPSTIGIDTLFRSGGNIPEAFLERAGIPETFITYARSLTTLPIEYYSCFICHSTNDNVFCDRLYADLRAQHVRVWYFPEDATWGEPMWGEIDQSIKLYDKLVIVCSENSLQSAPVLREIERGLQREDQEGKNVLFPVRIDDYLFGKWTHPRKADVLAKVVGDFRGWDHNVHKYAAAFERLIKALQSAGNPKTAPER